MLCCFISHALYNALQTRNALLVWLRTSHIKPIGEIRSRPRLICFPSAQPSFRNNSPVPALCGLQYAYFGTAPPKRRSPSVGSLYGAGSKNNTTRSSGVNLITLGRYIMDPTTQILWVGDAGPIAKRSPGTEVAQSISAGFELFRAVSGPAAALDSNRRSSMFCQVPLCPPPSPASPTSVAALSYPTFYAQSRKNYTPSLQAAGKLGVLERIAFDV